MSGVINNGTHPKALWPGMHKFWGKSYNEHPREWAEIFAEEKSSKAYEEDAEITGFGLAPVKQQAGSVSYDSENAGPTTRYTHVVYGLGYIVTREQLDDNQYEEISRKRIKSLAFSMRQTEEVVAANVLNRGFNSSYTGGDGVELFSDAHSTLDGTQSNEMATAADLSEAALESLSIQIMQAKNSRGLRIALMPKKIVVPPDLKFEAERILRSDLRVGTDHNDINALRSQGMFPDGTCINHYLTDADAFFIKTDAPDGMRRFTRRSTEFTKDNDFDTENAKAKATMRFSLGWTDWRGMYASPGAA